MNLEKILEERRKRAFEYPQVITTRRLSLKISRRDSMNVIYEIIFDNVLVGYIHIIEDFLDDTEIWYRIMDDYQGLGFCSEAVKGLLDNCPQGKFFLTIHRKNRPSKKVARKTGFKKKGRRYYIDTRKKSR
ncbi:MAG: GNAT family N-acetyltransferase [Clostridia bacterium]|nr:GNAT family N-acetyltransferase [Clostridia bacterium]